LICYWIYRSIDKKFIKGMYGINSKIRFIYRVIVKEDRNINPRYIVNTRYLFDEIQKIEVLPSRVTQDLFMQNCHPFVEYSFVIKNINIRGIKDLKKIEDFMEGKLVFPMYIYLNTDFSLTHEIGPQSILDCIYLAGNVYVKEGRDLFPTSDLI
jgi:hypothetical protein